MKILFLAPHPVYQERGSPIAVKMVLGVMSLRRYEVDLVTYPEGESIDLPNVRFHRVPNLPFVRNMRPGFSVKKLICDFFMMFKIMSLVMRNRYQLVHAVEESVFFALVLKALFRLPFVYDMDSSLAQQMVEQKPRLRFLLPVLNALEGLAVKHAEVVIPVCDALGDIARSHAPKKITVLYDVPLLERNAGSAPERLRETLDIRGVMAMYVGNLEPYQGIDLLLEGFALAAQRVSALDLVIIGGAAEDIEKYKQKAKDLGVEGRVHLLGPRPIKQLAGYLAQADMLVSPRIKGENTPMKIYSYLDSGKPVLATNLRTHTQVLDGDTALLVPPKPKSLAAGLVRLARSEDLRRELGTSGKRLIQEKYNYPNFYSTLTGVLDELNERFDLNAREPVNAGNPR
jgi:glycosyltransferase involved in cell wall biosynthesis